MLDTDFLLLPVLADYFLTSPQGQNRSRAFLEEESSLSPGTLQSLLQINVDHVLNLTRPFAEEPIANKLLRIVCLISRLSATADVRYAAGPACRKLERLGYRSRVRSSSLRRQCRFRPSSSARNRISVRRWHTPIELFECKFSSFSLGGVLLPIFRDRDR